MTVDVSVIIPAFNAAAFLATALETLLAQTHPHWEAIVVDDGSSDATRRIAATLAERDGRIRLLTQAHRGVSAARNTGIAAARAPWLLFLDADDLIAPTHLERMTEALLRDPGLDAVCCGWARFGPAGTVHEARRLAGAEPLFPVLAKTCPAALHAWLVRRALVVAVGGFDVSLRTCEDWDLWQRVARTGARIGTVDEVLAFYRTWSGSASVDGNRLLEDGLRVITRGHSADPRVPNPALPYRDGLPDTALPIRKLNYLCWCAGLLLGAGQDARPLLRRLPAAHGLPVSVEVIAGYLEEATPLPWGGSRADWATRWSALTGNLEAFLLALEAHVAAPDLAAAVSRLLERRAVEHAPPCLPLTVGRTHALQVDLEQPIPDLRLPDHVERAHCRAALDGEVLGAVEVPVFDGFVSGAILADAIVGELAWPILGRFFRRTLYPSLRMERTERGVAIARGGACLADGLAESDLEDPDRVHEAVGWTVLLQELWGRPDWTLDRFYDPRGVGDRAAAPERMGDWLTVETSHEIADVLVPGSELVAVLSIGGVAIGAATIPAEDGRVAAPTIRATLTRAAGFELCRAAVREGLLGRPFRDGASLRAALAEAAGRRGGRQSPVERPGGADPAAVGEGALILGRRVREAMDTSVSRRAALPPGLATELCQAARGRSQPVPWTVEGDGEPARVIYAPDVLGPATPSRPETSRRDELAVLARQRATRSRREHFERLFASGPDPWLYTSRYEQRKYEHALELLPDGPVDRALELGCAEGHFTIQLAPRVGSLLAVDVSQIALDRARERCSSVANVQLRRLDFVLDELPGPFDLIVCSEVLYYLGDRETLGEIGRKFAAALRPGGHLLLTHANLVVDEPDRTGFDWAEPFGAKTIAETFAAVDGLALARELRTPLYRVQLFRRDEPRAPSGARHARPRSIRFTQHAPPEPEVAAHICWQGAAGPCDDPPPASETAQLPILLYHRVAPAGAAALAPYRVTPEAFEEQLAFLRDAGYYSVRVEDWHAAMIEHRPLPGRAVLITFDDGYRDVLTHAWPLLRRYGFSATVFLVAGQIGGSNVWDGHYGESVPLLALDEIAYLRGQGVAFGSHGVSHRRLTALPPDEIAREALCSRLLLEDRIGAPVEAFAYPFGDEDGLVRHLAGACGYLYGLTTRPGRAGLWDPMLGLPRIDVSGRYRLADFVARLGG